MTGSFVMIAAKVSRKTKSSGNARTAKTSYFVKNAINSSSTSIPWKKKECRRDVALHKTERRLCKASKAAKFAEEEFLPRKIASNSLIGLT